MPEERTGVTLLNAASSWEIDTLPVSAWNPHIPVLAWLVASSRPRRCVELGTSRAASFPAICQVVARFCTDAECIGVDPWLSDTDAPWLAESGFETMQALCADRYADIASLWRVEPAEAAIKVDDSSVDLLHIAHPDAEGIDIATWLTKVRPGGIVMMTGVEVLGPAETTQRAWHELARACPSVVLGGFGGLGVAQVPGGGERRIVDFLAGERASVTALFRFLGERLQYRYLLGSEPTAPDGLRRFIAGLTDEHAEEMRRAEKQRLAEVQELEEHLSAQTDRATALRAETDLLSAKVAYYAGRHERELAEVRAAHTREVDAMRASRDDFEIRLAERDAQLRTLWSSRSWKITRPMRVLLRMARRIAAVTRVK